MPSQLTDFLHLEAPHRHASVHMRHGADRTPHAPPVRVAGAVLAIISCVLAVTAALVGASPALANPVAISGYDVELTPPSGCVATVDVLVREHLLTAEQAATLKRLADQL